LLAVLIGFATTIYLNFYGSVKNLKAANTVYEEARFVMERITKEIRNGTIDYEEYYNQSLFKNRFPGSYELVKNETYGQDYCQYSLLFYKPGNDGEIGTADDESTGKREDLSLAAVGPSPIQSDLFLINMNGDKRAYLRRIEKTDGSTGQKIGRVGLIKMTGGDFGVDHIDATDNLEPTCVPDAGENDGRIDTWVCDDGFTCDTKQISSSFCSGKLCGEGAPPDSYCEGLQYNIIYNPLDPTENSYLDITPTALDIVSLEFIISPEDDPRKDYNVDAMQIQPSVTIKLVARANPKLAAGFTAGQSPNIILTSTVSARAYNEIITECNLKQCFPGTKKDCPLTEGVCAGSTQECTPSFLWSGCTEEIYEIKSGGTYEKGSEIASCAIGDDDCKEKLCSDGFDNDCNGFTDEDDPYCKYWMCNNGIRDQNKEGEYIENCINVGGICQQIRPYQPGQEISCSDDYDNDCDGNADEFDYDCILQICNNGEKDSGFVNYLTYMGSHNSLVGATTDPTLDEKTIDIGGICQAFVDKEFDASSGTDGVKEGRITGYNPEEPPTTGGTRLLPDATFTEKETGDMCYDGLDNDNDGKADEFDSDCLPTICNDNKQNCDIAPTDYSTPNYLVTYVDNTCTNPGLGKTDEYCKNVGGICNNFREVIVPKYFDHKKISSENVAQSLTPTTGTCTETDCPLTSAANLCTDGLDNDCDEKGPDGVLGNADDQGADWKDKDCCPDLDGDGYITLSATCQPPSFADGGPQYLDCNDSDPKIHPFATEVCGNAIDENCNGKSDSDDPACCVDTDGDKFGVADAWQSCERSKATGKADCLDTNKDVNPDVFENTETLCFNYSGTTPIDDNCNGRANHIDWYWNPIDGTAKAFKDKLFESACCDLTAIEICDDNTYGTHGSDENCNGLEGTNDNYCVTENRKGFLDNLTTNAYISLDTGLVQNSETGIVTLGLPTDIGNVTSGSLASILDLTSCTGSYRVFLSPAPTVTTPGATTIRFQLSGDGGTIWCGNGNCTGDWIDMSEIASTVDFTNPNYQLRWRAELAGDPLTSSVPTLDKVTINFSCL
jgi:hypothetical protein